MRQECRERFPRHRLQRKPLVSDLNMRNGMCVTHVPWCMSGSLTGGGEENVPGIPGTCATRHFGYLQEAHKWMKVPQSESNQLIRGKETCCVLCLLWKWSRHAGIRTVIFYNGPTAHRSQYLHASTWMYHVWSDLSFGHRNHQMNRWIIIWFFKDILTCDLLIKKHQR